MAKILITGGSGLLGKAISELLLKNNYEPIWLSREFKSEGVIKKYKWDIATNYIDERAFEDVEHIIHLAGAGIADKRWTPDYKAKIIDSRVKSSELLYNYIIKHNYPIKTLIGGSAIGYYGARQSNLIVTEEEFAGKDFLAQTCLAWEKSYTPFINHGIRTAIIRTGIVLSKLGGAYPKMAPAFKLGLGAALASGKQNFPWIHINDIASIFVYCLINKNLIGTFNGVSSEFVSNYVFSETLAKSFNKPFFMPNIPEFVLKLAIGEGAIMVAEGLKISNSKLKNTGFKFEYETLSEALKTLA